MKIESDDAVDFRKQLVDVSFEEKIYSIAFQSSLSHCFLCYMGIYMKILGRRFTELLEQLQQVESTQSTRHNGYAGGGDRYIEEELIINWTVKAKSLINNACGRESEHYAAFVKADEPQPYEDNVTRFKRLKAVFTAALEDFNGGYLNTVRNFIHAEVAGDEIEQARELLKAGYTSAAAVVAGVVLETTLRAVSQQKGLPVGSMDRMNADLAKAGHYNGLVQKRITALAAIRNSAAHGKVDEFAADDVKNLIIEVERIVADMLT